ncbi:MAG: hypothetical protein AB7O59_20505 [Pirellulales bacterium]
MLELKCNRCGATLTRPGALVFSPPVGQEWLVEKYHVCAECWTALRRQIQADGEENREPDR